jgi:hypothetical protein
MSITIERSFFFLEKMDKGLPLVPGMLGNAAGSFDRRNLGALIMNSPFFNFEPPFRPPPADDVHEPVSFCSGHCQYHTDRSCNTTHPKGR